MKRIDITEKISYIEATEEPLSADIGIIKSDGMTWLYDVGSSDECLPELNVSCNIVLSHFHQDHTGNIDKLNDGEIFASKETFAHIHKGTVVSQSVHIGNLHIFPLPSSHAKGCLGLEVDDTYAFVGDALYCKAKNGRYVFNAQVLKDEIDVLKKLRASFLLVSHYKGLIRKKEDVIAELETIYKMRTANSPEIIVS